MTELLITPTARDAAGHRRATFAAVAPFAVFIALLGAQQLTAGPHLPWLVARCVLVTAAILVFTRGRLSWRTKSPVSSVLVGVAVFVIWVGPDLLWPGYRTHWILQNGITGRPESTIPPALRTDAWFLLLRTASSVVLVPIIEELFWRGWLMRWLVRSDFTSVPLGTFTPASFWVTALLFATEHGAFWDVGLLAGIAYNRWMLRTRSLSDCILAHAVTNACLAAYVVFCGRWQYWL